MDLSRRIMEQSGFLEKSEYVSALLAISPGASAAAAAALSPATPAAAAADKFITPSLVLGTREEAALGLANLLGLDDESLAERMRGGVRSIGIPATYGSHKCKPWTQRGQPCWLYLHR